MKRLIIIAGLASALSSVAFAQDDAPIELGCDAIPGHVCHFLITRGTSRVLAKIESGKRAAVNPARANVDWYMVAIDRDPPSDPTACGKAFPCKRATFKPGYNN